VGWSCVPKFWDGMVLVGGQMSLVGIWLEDIESGINISDNK
jgi:hypothetical protein